MRTHIKKASIKNVKKLTKYWNAMSSQILNREKIKKI